MPETVPIPEEPQVEPRPDTAPSKPQPKVKPSPFEPDWPADRPLPQPKGIWDQTNWHQPIDAH